MTKKKKVKKKKIGKKKIGKKKINNIIIHCEYSELVDTDRLVHHPANPNKHSEKQVEKLARLIEIHGWRHPVTVSNRSGYIVSGHCRHMAAKLKGLKQVPVDLQDFENEAEELAVLIADNIVQEFAEVDGLKMADVLVALDEVNYPLELTALDPGQIEDYVVGPTDYGDLDKENENMAGMEGGLITIEVPEKHSDKVISWLANGEQKTQGGLGKGVMKRCGLL